MNRDASSTKPPVSLLCASGPSSYGPNRPFLRPVGDATAEQLDCKPVVKRAPRARYVECIVVLFGGIETRSLLALPDLAKVEVEA